MSIPQVSERAKKTPPSPIRKLAHLAAEAKARGTKVYHLNIGQPDIKTPEEFWDGLDVFSQSVLAYEQSEGNAALSKAWCAYMNRTLQLSTDPKQFLITTGASEALIFAFMVCSDPGDDFIIIDPTYANYIGFAAIAGITLTPVTSKFDDNFSLPEIGAIAAKITKKTRGILLCSPNNPTGTIYTRKELEALLSLCDERNIFFIVDETYREFTYDGAKPLSILHIAPANKRVIVVDSLSKRFSLCGARIGALISSNEEFMAMCLNLAQARLAAPTLGQHAAAYMLEKIGDGFVDGIRTEYEGRRNTICKALREIPGVEVHKPHGAFYAVVRLPVPSAEDFARYMLTDFSFNGATTFVAPASGFYMDNARGQNKIRVAYVLNEKDLVSAVGVLGEGLQAFRKAKGV